MSHVENVTGTWATVLFIPGERHFLRKGLE